MASFRIPTFALICGLAIASSSAFLAWGPMQETTLKISIDPQLFEKGSLIRLFLFNQADLAAQERNRSKFGSCFVSFSQQQGEVTQCLDGKKYEPEPVLSEKHEAKLSEIQGIWSLHTKHLSLGQKYSIGIDGKSADGCNSTSAHYEGVLDSPLIELSNLSWMSTEKACRMQPSTPD